MSKQETTDSLLSGIISALDVTAKSIASIEETYIDNKDGIPSIIEELMQKANIDKLEGVSLLSLKNSSLLSYLNNLALILLSHLERLKKGENIDKVESAKQKGVENTIIQRVTLEKGIKPLEKKLNYQLDKMIRSYNRTLEDEAKIESKVTKAKENKNTDSDSDSDSDDSEESEDDALSYRPDAAALAKLSQSDTNSKPIKSSNDEKTEEVYKPPKISAVAPPVAAIADKGQGKNSNRKLQSMEEYLVENSDIPQSEVSIGSSIVNNGRGGVKTNKDRQKEQEVQTYEENNFTRLPSTATKKTFRQKQSEKVNNFAGEDWSMFGNSRNIEEGTTRKRKPTTAWDKVKKRRS